LVAICGGTAPETSKSRVLSGRIWMTHEGGRRKRVIRTYWSAGASRKGPPGGERALGQSFRGTIASRDQKKKNDQVKE